MDTTNKQPSIRALMMPRDTNAVGSIFGGLILSYIDQAGAVEAYDQGCERVVTVAMKEVEFHGPVYVGDLLSLFCETVRVGRTSITVHVYVEVERARDREVKVHVTDAEVTYVNVGADNRPLPIEAGGD